MVNDKICKACRGENITLAFIKKDVEYYKCRDCNFVFVPSKYRTKIDYREYKNEAVYHEIVRGNNWLKTQRHRLRVKLLKRYERNCHLLDVGSGWGHFLKTAIDMGYVGDGVELSSYPHKYSTENLGLSVTNENLFDIDPRHKYDIVTMWDVLEHIDDADGAIMKVNDLLRNGGYFVFQIPQWDGWLSKKLGQDWHSIGVDHVNYFSASNIGKILVRNGFELVSIKTSIEVKLYVMYHFLNKKNKGKRVSAAERQAHYNKKVDRPRWQLRLMVLTHNLIYRLLQILRMGDEMIVIAKKQSHV
jgi:2-polyprenyl-3-methyl-5-hydroxy-6-metoxy-1,4-benzoquinol methylase